MNVDTDKFKISNQDEEGIWEWESDDKVYSLTLGMVVFDKTNKTFTYVTDDENLKQMGFNVYDYDNINWEPDPSN